MIQGSTVLLVLVASFAFETDLLHACEEDTFHCHESNPNLYLRCVNGYLMENACPEGLQFSTHSQTCDWPQNSDCPGGGSSMESDADLSQYPVDNAEYEQYLSPSDDYNPPQVHSAPAAEQISQFSDTGDHWWEPVNVGSNYIEKAMDKLDKFDNGYHMEAPDYNQEPVDHSGHDHNLNGPCTESGCFLPDCYCPTTEIPNGISPADTPQMVMITFDDEMNSNYLDPFDRIFSGKKNPNGCSIAGALFLSGDGTEWDLVTEMYSRGFEIADHTISHRYPHTWWSWASFPEYYAEIAGQKSAIAENAGIPENEIQGFRVPFLQIGGDNMYKAIADSGLTYDSSIFTGSESEADEPVWPHTLSFVPDDMQCQLGPCPTSTYPGIWEIPIQRWFGLDGNSCAMADGCHGHDDAESLVSYLRKNFNRYYHTNRAPFGLFIHARWLGTPYRLEAVSRFVSEILEKDDVWVVTPSMVLDWMRHPKSNDQAGSVFSC